MATVKSELDCYDESDQHAFVESDSHARNGAGVEWEETLHAGPGSVIKIAFKHRWGYFAGSPAGYWLPGTPSGCGVPDCSAYATDSDGNQRAYRTWQTDLHWDFSHTSSPGDYTETLYRVTQTTTKWEGNTSENRETVYGDTGLTDTSPFAYPYYDQMDGYPTLNVVSISDSACHLQVVWRFYNYGYPDYYVDLTADFYGSDGETVSGILENDVPGVYGAAPALSTLDGSGPAGYIHYYTKDDEENLVEISEGIEAPDLMYGAANTDALETGFKMNPGNGGFYNTPLGGVWAVGVHYRIHARDWYIRTITWNATGAKLTDTNETQPPANPIPPAEWVDFYLEPDFELDGKQPYLVS